MEKGLEGNSPSRETETSLFPPTLTSSSGEPLAKLMTIDGCEKLELKYKNIKIRTL